MTDLCKINKTESGQQKKNAFLKKGGVRILLTIGIDKSILFDYNKNREGAYR